MNFQNRNISVVNSENSSQGYALVEYETRREAEAAIERASGSTLLDQTLTCDYAFVRPPGAPAKPSQPKVKRRSVSPQREVPLRSRID